LPHVIRFPQLPIRRHIQENLYKKALITDNLSKSESNLKLKDHSLGNIDDINLYKYESQKSWNIESDLTQKLRDNLNVQIDAFLYWYSVKWNDFERNEFLRQLLLKLDPRIHYFILSYLAVRNPISLKVQLSLCSNCLFD
jgi:hypothetical protein